MKKGVFITIYGINNMGKTTHVNLLAERLRGMGFDARTIKYPMYSVEPSGSYINHVLRGGGAQKIAEDELQLWYVVNRYQFQPELVRLLGEGKIVIAEDYSGTGIAWGISKGLPEDWIISANKFLLEPDLAVLFQGARQMHAREKTHIHEQNDDLMKRCESVHDYLADKFGWQRLTLQDRVEDTEAILWEIVEDFLKSKGML